MIVYGTQTKQIATEKTHSSCTNCGTLNSIQMFIVQKYAHVFWIPFFPIGKTAVTQCSHCKQVLQKKEFSPSLKSAYENLIPHAKTPYWTFSGLAAVVLFISWIAINDKQNDEKYATMISAPQKGDVYEIKMDNKRYTLYRVENIIDDTVFVVTNEYETNKFSGLTDLKEKAYAREQSPILKPELKIMLDNGTIMNVDRK